MHRRLALQALVAGCGLAALPCRSQAPSSGKAAVMAWGPAGVCVSIGEEPMRMLADRPALGIAPVATRLGLWLVDTEGRLRSWAAAEDGRWRLRRAASLDEPVHAIAASPDGRWVAAAHGERLSLLDSDGERVKTLAGTDLARRRRGAATALFMLPQRRSFVAVWPALGESWEVSVDPDAPPIFDGLVHDYRMREGIAAPGYLGARRTLLEPPLPELVFADSRVPWLAGTSADQVTVLHLDVRRRIATLSAAAANPAGATLRADPGRQGRFEWWLPAGRQVLVIDTSSWTPKATHSLPGTVQQLLAIDSTLWALISEAGAATLWRRAADGEWQAVGGLCARASALRAALQPRQLLLLCNERPAVLQLDEAGGVQRRWPLPSAGPWLDLASWWIA